MAAASSNNVTNASHHTSQVEVVASSSTVSHDTGLVSSHLNPTQIVLSNALPPATSIRSNASGNSISIHSAMPLSPSNCHHITLTEVKSNAELVPLLLNHQHDHHYNHHHEGYHHDILADSSTLIDPTTSPIITTTSALSDSEHEIPHHSHQMLNLMDDCSATSSPSITTSTLVNPSPSSTSLTSPRSVMVKAEPTTSTVTSMSSLVHHNNNNTILFDAGAGDPLLGVAVAETHLTHGIAPRTSPGEFLQQCPSSQLDNIHISESRVIVTQSTSSSMSSSVQDSNNSLGSSRNELHELSSVICSPGSVEIGGGQTSQQLHSRFQTQTSNLSREDKSCSTDNLNLSITTTENSLSSGSSKSDDIDLSDEKLDESGGYQDNTSSNSQQSGGGGSVSGGTGGIGSNSYVSLIQPSIGQSGGVVGGHSVTGSLAGGTGIGGHGGGGGMSGGGGGPHHGVPGQAGPMQTGISEQTDFKYLFEELCPVCGDKVSGYHYGLLTCESCKGFFKRTVQNKKVYTCVAERRCLIDKTQRKRCPYCRFQKCLDVGMKLEAVRADRMRGGRNKFGPMYKRDRARKLQMMRQRQLALQAIRGSMSTADLKPGQISPTGYQQSYPSMNIKQEIQIPQVSSLTQSPDSSPSPIAIALGQVNPSSAITATALSGSSTNTTTVSGAGGGSGSCGPGSDNGSSSMQHSSDSKICFDSGTNPSSTADSVSTVELRVSPMIREFVQSVDDREWQTQLFTLLQKQSYNQVEVDLFELMCKVLDQNLFSQVDWARNTVFFKDLKVDDQMKLLQYSWSDMLVLDHLHHRIHNGLPDETPLHNGQIFNLLNLGLLGVPQLGDYFNELQNKLQELKFDMGDYVCMKFLILLNPNVRGIINRKTVLEGHENVQAALLDYTLTCYPSVSDKFSRLLNILPEIHAMATRGEEHLYIKHCAGSAPTQTLLMEMLHAKRKV